MSDALKQWDDGNDDRKGRWSSQSFVNVTFVFFLSISPASLVKESSPDLAVGGQACPQFLGPKVAQMRPAQLRVMAQACGSGRMENLYLHRAVANELAESYRQYRQLDSARYGQDDRASFEAYRMTIALMESFAANGYALGESHNELVDAMNLGYEQLNDVAEMRLKGYDRVADYQLRQWMKAWNEPRERGG